MSRVSFVAGLPELKVRRFSCGGCTAALGILRGREEDGLPYSRLPPMLEGHRLVAEFNSGHGTSLRMIQPRTADRALSDPAFWFFLGGCSPFLTDAVIAYTEPREALGPEVVFQSGGRRIVFPACKYRGEKGIALLAWGVTCADFSTSGTDVLLDVPESRILPIRRFPSESGAAIRHPMLTAPPSDGQALEDQLRRAVVLQPGLRRILWRVFLSSYVGPVARTSSPQGDWHHVLANRPPSQPFGVVVEIPERDAGRFGAPE